MAGHQGVRRSLNLLSRYFWWPSMVSDVKEHVRTCPICQRVKSRHHQPYGMFHGHVPGIRRWEEWSMDFITDLPKSRRGNDAIHVVLDSTSKRLRLDAVTMKITSLQVLDLLFNVIIRNHGLPRRIICDRDPRYTARPFIRRWSEALGVKLSFSIPFNPLHNSWRRA